MNQCVQIEIHPEFPVVFISMYLYESEQGESGNNTCKRFLPENSIERNKKDTKMPYIQVIRGTMINNTTM